MGGARRMSQGVRPNPTGKPSAGMRAEPRMLHLGDEPVGAHLRAVERLADGLHRAGRDLRGAEQRDPFLPALRVASCCSIAACSAGRFATRASLVLNRSSAIKRG